MKKRLKSLAIDKRALRKARVRKTQLQVGALCYRQGKKGLRILLITSRGTGRWIIPKGWPMRKMTAAEAAAQEAFEEAGVEGKINPRSLGFFNYHKDLGRGLFVPCLVQVYAMQVADKTSNFPEAAERQVKWFRPQQAMKRVHEPGLRKLIRAFAHEMEPEPAPEVED